MLIEPGTRLGPYEVLSPLGRGGMGEVWRARDTRLDREVAIKTLPEEFASDPNRLARFEREARLLASLNHPNIGSIYGLEESAGTQVLVLELVEGETLADRLQRGPIPVEEALTLARQIAEALEAAHEKGVIHRDLKPANVKVRPDGTVKVLDFGLAKTLSPETASAAEDLSESPTIAAPAMTQMGTVLGTAAYMSPEQARGTAVDRRADIWAFGCVLFETLTGRGPFQGETAADSLAQLLEREPDWPALPAGTPPAIDTLLRRCLEKRAEARLPHMGAARLEIAEALAHSSRLDHRTVAGLSSLGARGPRRAAGLVKAASLAVGLGLVGLLGWRVFAPDASGPAPDAATSSRVSVNPVAGESWVISPHDPDFAISADGNRLAYLGRRGERNELVVRPLDAFEGVSLGSFGGVVRHPLFSPDGEWVAFVDGNVLKKVTVDGHRTVTICVLPGYMSGATWGGDNVITFGTLNNGLFQVSSAGGTPTPLATAAQTEGRAARWPEILPGDGAVLFAAVGTGQASEIRVRSLVTDEEHVVVSNATFPRYAHTGHLLYVAGGVLWGVRFDAQSLTALGEPQPVVDRVLIKGPEQTGIGAADVALSATGTLVYRPSGAGGSEANTLVLVDRDGREEPLGAEPRPYGHPQLSPDGTQLAVEVTDTASNSSDIWVGAVGGAALSQLTFDAAADQYPVWTPDGRDVVFQSSRDGGGLYRKRADGSGPVELLLAKAESVQLYFITPDGEEAVYRRVQSRQPLTFQYFGLQLSSGVARPVAATAGPVGAISPDGRWMAYSSEETGAFEVYVQPYPNPDGVQVRVSPGGGRDPVWSRNGREIFYQNDTITFAAPVTLAATVAVAPPVALFDAPYVDSLGRWYDVGPDGRFLMVKPGWLSVGPEAPLNVVLNWHPELNRLVPGD